MLSLADEVHQELKLSNLAPGEIQFLAASSEQAQAFSTYLHETIHWWQHVGSFSGFLQTCIYPAITHLNYGHLINILATFGPKKSILQLLEQEVSKPSSTATDDLNIVINNTKDLLFFVAATQDPLNLEVIAADKFFEGRGHCFGMAYIALLSALSAFDPTFDVPPNPATWQSAIQARKISKEIEYYYGSRVRVPPIGLHALFEGQAKFSQMQYLYAASGETLEWGDFKAAGMFGDIYVEAFKLFLNLTGNPFPDNVRSPAVGLFLLICDLAINPTDGFPLVVRSFDTFVDDVDPGTRFLRLCQAVRGESGLLHAVTDFSREEYVEVSSALCNLASITHPNVGLNATRQWKLCSSIIDQIVKEGEVLKFEPVNMALRLAMSKFLAFCEDRILHPEFFCWPGAGMAEPKAHKQAIYLFQRHQSLFTNRADKRGVFPRLMTGIDPIQCVDTLTDFYQWNALYDMTQQWILEAGGFDLSFDWLMDGSNEEMYQWANQIFESMFGVRPESFRIL